MQKIVPHLWYDKEAKEAAALYVSAFGDGSRVVSSSVLNDTPSGSVDVLSFELWGYRFDAISAGPYFKFTPAISISVQCRSEEEIDRMHGILSEGGQTLMPLDRYPWSDKYAWISDRYGLSWQLNLPKDQSEIKDRIAPFLLFVGDKAGKAEEAMGFYASTFPDSSVNVFARHGKGEEPEEEGTIKHAEFRLFGEPLMAMDSKGPHSFAFNEAVSLMVRCKGQEEIDYFWQKLSAVPEAEQCGWLKDAYGVSWQIVPEEMDVMMASGTPEQRERVTKAFLSMKKFDLAALQRAYEG